MNRPPPSQADIDRLDAMVSPILDRVDRGEITQAEADAQLEALMHRDAVAHVEARMAEHAAARRRRGTIVLWGLVLLTFVAAGWVIATRL